jgi:MinD-like ATPase involved in chromosome partitioning or flagellar assembly
MSKESGVGVPTRVTPPATARHPDESVPSDYLPRVESSRRKIDPAQRALLLLGTEYPLQRMGLLRSEALLAAVSHVIAVTDLLPEEVASTLVSMGTLDPVDPVATLIARAKGLAVDDRRTLQPHEASATVRTTSGTEDQGDASESPTAHRRGSRTGQYQPRRVARPIKRTATRGWRKSLRTATAGLVKLGPGRDELIELALVEEVQSPIDGYRHVAVLSLKGGSGKTTTTVMLGHMFASLRGDRVAAIDASPDAGTLAYRIHDEPAASVRTLLDNAESLRRYVDVSAISAHAESRLDIIASDPDPSVTRPFGSADYRKAAEIMTRFYSLVLTDCGAGLMHDAMGSVLDSADQMILVMTPAVDGARSAELTLDWLDAHGFSDLVSTCVVVINSIDKTPVVDVDELCGHFETRCRAVARIPFDRHLAEGGATHVDRLSRASRRAYLDLAATVANGFDDETSRRARSL